MDENQNAIKYAAIYSMIMSLLKKGKIDMEEAEEIKTKLEAEGAKVTLK